jgi:hypothetical protein
MPPPNVNWVEVSKKCSFLIRSQVSGPDNISLSPLLGPSSFDSSDEGPNRFWSEKSASNVPVTLSPNQPCSIAILCKDYFSDWTRSSG